MEVLDSEIVKYIQEVCFSGLKQEENGVLGTEIDETYPGSESFSGMSQEDTEVSDTETGERYPGVSFFLN